MTLPAPEPPAQEPPPPPGYRVIRALGGGGMGSVWLCARGLGLGGITQRAVLKRPRPDPGGAVTSAGDRFVDEVRALARIGHRNVVRLLDAGADAAGPWLAVEHVDGLDGAALLELARGATALDPAAGFTGAELGWVVHEVAAGLTAAHGAVDELGRPAPVLHRDVSPQNVLLSRDGEVKLADFGIARPADAAAHTTTGVVVGNLRYIAPEQLEGRAVGPRTDVYGLGRVLEELLTAAAPGDDAAEALQGLAARCTRRAPEERPESAAAVQEAVREGVREWSTGAGQIAARVRRALDAREQMRAAVAGMLGHDDASGEVSPRGDGTAAMPRATVPEPVPGASVATVAKAPRRRAGVVVGVTAAVALAGAAAGWRERARPDPETRMQAKTPVASPVAPMPALATARAQAPRAQAPGATDVGAPVVVTARGPARVAARRAAADAGAVAPVEARAGATLRVSSLPFALVSVDGSTPVGTPHTFALGAGEHTVTARFALDGAVRESRRAVVLAGGETRTLGLVPE